MESVGEAAVMDLAVARHFALELAGHGALWAVLGLDSPAAASGVEDAE